uniref:SCP domain-containing protein n=2 Tax=Angiostrongylus cantonensis TaxID=6313 RepID=A0A0K0D5B5_ANGCA
LEQLAAEAVEGCPTKPPESSKANYTNFDHSELDQGPINTSHVTITSRLISYWRSRLQSRLKMLRPDIHRVGCAAAKCPETSGIVNVTVACIYGEGGQVAQVPV